MNHNDVLLIGVGPTDADEMFEPWVYTVNAPTNLWIGALCDDGSRMGLDFMAHMLNGLIDADAFNEGDTYVILNQDGIALTATVGEWVSKADVQAFRAESENVRKVTVAVSR